MEKYNLAYLQLDKLDAAAVKEFDAKTITITKEGFLNCIIDAPIYANDLHEAVNKTIDKFNKNVFVHLHYDRKQIENQWRWDKNKMGMLHWGNDEKIQFNKVFLYFFDIEKYKKSIEENTMREIENMSIPFIECKNQ